MASWRPITSTYIGTAPQAYELKTPSMTIQIHQRSGNQPHGGRAEPRSAPAPEKLTGSWGVLCEPFFPKLVFLKGEKDEAKMQEDAILYLKMKFQALIKELS